MVVGSLVIGLNQELATDILHDTVRIIGDFGHDGAESFLGFGEVAIIDGVAALTLSAVGDAEDRESLVFCGAHEMEALGIGLVVVDELVLGLRSTDAMEIDSVKNVFGREFVARIGRRIAAIEETSAGPADVGGFDPL